MKKQYRAHTLTTYKGLSMRGYAILTHDFETHDHHTEIGGVFNGFPLVTMDVTVKLPLGESVIERFYSLMKTQVEISAENNMASIISDGVYDDVITPFDFVKGAN
jgi:hypothetical protein